jgi:hypothetical protein
LQFACRKCGKTLGADVMLAKEHRCKCGYLFLDPTRKCRRLYRLVEKRSLNERPPI